MPVKDGLHFEDLVPELRLFREAFELIRSVEERGEDLMSVKYELTSDLIKIACMCGDVDGPLNNEELLVTFAFAFDGVAHLKDGKFLVARWATLDAEKQAGVVRETTAAVDKWRGDQEALLFPAIMRTIDADLDSNHFGLTGAAMCRFARFLAEADGRINDVERAALMRVRDAVYIPWNADEPLLSERASSRAASTATDEVTADTTPEFLWDDLNVLVRLKIAKTELMGVANILKTQKDGP